MKIDDKYQPILLEALEDMMYKLSLELEGEKGKPMSKYRRELTKKQAMVEKLQHLISTLLIFNQLWIYIIIFQKYSLRIFEKYQTHIEFILMLLNLRINL